MRLSLVEKGVQKPAMEVKMRLGHDLARRCCRKWNVDLIARRDEKVWTIFGLHGEWSTF